MSEFLKINVSEHIEKKNNLSYLSWAWAWAEVLKIDPQATWEAFEFNGFPASFAPDGSALVKVQVTIKGHTKTCWLPVMDHKNKAIKNPDAFAINTAMVRCLTKCISMHGLGLYIYAGEDLPEDQRRSELTEFALDLIGMHRVGKTMDAAKAFHQQFDWAKDAPTKAEEQKFVWSLLSDESGLRSTIKANKPEPATV